MRRSAPALLPLFRSDVQAEVLAHFFITDEQATVSELARALGEHQATVQREVARLIASGVLSDSRTGRNRVVRANRENPIYPHLRGLLEVVYGPKVLLEHALGQLANVEQAFIFGSWAARYLGEAGAAPGDIDLMIIGRPDPAVVDNAVTEVEHRLGREVNFVLVNGDAWEDRAGDPFLENVAAGPMVGVRGSSGESGAIRSVGSG
jgi:hypothetical protein